MSGTTRSRWRIRGLLPFLLAFSSAGHAVDLAGFNESVARAMGPYRSTMHYLRTGNAMVAGFEAQRAAQAWEQVMSAVQAQPPDAFSRDPSFLTTVQEVGARLADGARILAGVEADAEAAAQRLRSVRRRLSALRTRNGLYLLADCVLELNDASDALHGYRKTPPAAGDTAAVNALKASAAIYGHLLARCDAWAPAEVKADPEFRRLMDGVSESVSLLVDAVDSGDKMRLVNLLREIRSFDRMLRLRFG